MQNAGNEFTLMQNTLIENLLARLKILEFSAEYMRRTRNDGEQFQKYLKILYNPI